MCRESQCSAGFHWHDCAYLEMQKWVHVVDQACYKVIVLGVNLAGWIAAVSILLYISKEETFDIEG